MIKKVIVGLIILLVMINVKASNIIGDINNDIKINTTDYILIRKHLLKTNVLFGEELKRADVNGDGTVNSADYIAIRKAILGDNIKLSLPADNNAYYNNTKFTKNNKENPFVSADPSIIYENGVYYLFATFSGDGVKYYSSKDMINWEDKGYIVDKKTFNGGSQSSFNAFWAPEVFKYNGKYYLLYSAGTTSNWHIQLYLAVSDKLTSGWSYYTKIPLDKYDALNIDGTVLIENNNAYLYYHAKNELYGVKLSSDLKNIIDTPTLIFYPKQSWANHSQPALNEGPSIFKYNGKYYLMYSANDYYTKWYGVGYATSSSPLGPFADQSIANPLLSSSDGPGHNSVFTIDGSNYYIVYHSIIWKNNTYSDRKLNVDQIGVDSNGKLYINGPSKDNQPLPSGQKGKKKLNSGEYDVLINSTSAKELKDNINYNVANTANYLKINPVTNFKTYTANSIMINVSNKKIEDIWLYSNINGFQGVSAKVVINGRYVMENVKVSDGKTAKIQLPKINENINKIQIDFSKNITLSEIGLYTFSS